MSANLASLLRMLGGVARTRRVAAEDDEAAASNNTNNQSTGFADHELGKLIHYRTELHDRANHYPINQSLFTHSRMKKSNVYPSVNQSTNQVDQHHSSRFIPNYKQSVNHFDARAFCTSFARDGKTFVVATQDNQLHLYDTVDALCQRVDETDHDSPLANQTTNQSNGRSNSPFQPFKQIAARHVGWSIIDVDYSPNSEFVAYSTWSPYVQLCNVFGSFELHEACDMQPFNNERFNQRICFFSIKFSPDGRTVLGGASDGCWYLFDIERKQRVLCVGGHSDDINSVCFADVTGNLVCTGSDDRTIRLWDVRVCSNVPIDEHGRNPSSPVGSFLGHSEGVTCVTSAEDGRLIASNGKDNCLKVWDLRCLRSASEADDYEQQPRSDYDYRYSGYQRTRSTARHAMDTSIATMRGHRVADTLVRCHFSPAATTSNRYVYTGSFGGSVFIYDCLTGEVITKLEGHTSTVRDCSWHPYEPIMLTAAWDNSVGLWTYSGDFPSNNQTSQSTNRTINSSDPAMALFDDHESDDDAEDRDYMSHDASDDEDDDQGMQRLHSDDNMDEEHDDDNDDDDDDEEDEYEIEVDDETFNQTVMAMLADAMMNGIDPTQLIERLDQSNEVEEKEDDEEDVDVDED